MSKLELHKSDSFQFGNLFPESKCRNGNVAEATSTVGVGDPVLPVRETGPESGKQEEDVPGVEVIHAEDLMAGVVEAVLPVHETGWESGNQDNVSMVEIIHVEDQSTTKPAGNNR